MRVFFASDLHYDVAVGAAATAALAKSLLAEARPDDVLILGGDYANSDEMVRECLAHFVDFPGKKLGIAGNHDVWVDTVNETSRARYRRLGELFAEVGVHPLEDEPLIVGDVGFVGSIGWYDYSFRVPSLEVPLEVYERKGFPGLPGAVWNDGRNVNWPVDDVTFTDELLTRMAEHLHQIESVDRIIVATHHVPTNGLLRPAWLPSTVPRRMVVPRKWLILNTYLGSQRFEDLLARYAERIEVAFCGHIHLARHVERRGIDFVSNGSDHKHKELTVWEDGEFHRDKFRG